MDKLLNFIKGKPWYVKVAVIAAAAVITYFASGCAYKFHADKIDNVTREISISRP